jgi:hypothetical protein
MTMADLVVVMGEGRIRQAGSPLDLYRRPADCRSWPALSARPTSCRPERTDAGRRCPAAHRGGLTMPGGGNWGPFRSGRRTSGSSRRRRRACGDASPSCATSGERGKRLSKADGRGDRQRRRPRESAGRAEGRGDRADDPAGEIASCCPHEPQRGPQPANCCRCVSRR